MGVNPGMRLVNNPTYPEIAEDFTRGFKVMRSLPVDVPLGSHPGMYNLAAKHARLGRGGQNPYIDPQGYKAEIDLVEGVFKSVLEEQRKTQ
jgi:metallo-beta-lactamase class B